METQKNKMKEKHLLITYFPQYKSIQAFCISIVKPWISSSMHTLVTSYYSEIIIE